MRTELKEREDDRPITAPLNRRPITASDAVLPLRLFLAISFIAAAWDKLSDPQFLDSTASRYIGKQLGGFAGVSPIGDFLTNVAVPNATLFGLSVLLGELAIGLGTLVGLFARTSAFFEAVLGFTLWLSTTWHVKPFFLASDLPYALGWITLFVAGVHPILSLDGQIARWLAQRNNPASPLSVLVPGALARRNFVIVAGASVVGGGVSLIAWGNTLKKEQPVAIVEDTPVATPTTNPFTTVAGTATANTGVTAAPTSAAAVSGAIVAKLSDIAPGDAKTFRTPDTKERAILIRLPNDSLKAYNTACTHDGCEVAYNKALKSLECPCHDARFELEAGKPTSGPTVVPLKAYKVQADGAGNIIFVSNTR